MYWVVLSMLCMLAKAAKVPLITYLPPPNAKEAGGHERDLLPPLEPPYIDPYSDSRVLASNGRRDGIQPISRTLDDNDDIRIFPNGQGKLKSRFLYGSYSYTGPDNILVTVTYTADRKKPRDGSVFYKDCDYSKRRFDWYDADGDDYDTDDDVIPTPPSLPRELEKAFAFHRRKYQHNDQKDDKKIGKTFPESRQPWKEQPIIHQGYSNSRASNTKN